MAAWKSTGHGRASRFVYVTLDLPEPILMSSKSDNYGPFEAVSSHYLQYNVPTQARSLIALSLSLAPAPRSVTNEVTGHPKAKMWVDGTLAP